MKLYYTGSDAYNEAQDDKDKSLGGFKSSTLIPNDLANNLFGDISMYSLNDKLRETRALIFLNDAGSALTNLYIHFDKATGALGTFEVAAVAITPNQAGEVFMESIGNIRATPFTGTFVEADGVANKQLLSASLADNTYLGLWIRRRLTSADKTQFECDTLNENFISDPKVPVVVDGNVDVVLSWD
jgi:hypothetical protein